ncbi:MAG: DUF6090 family protein [Bacteroidota bacterium]
MSNYLNDSNMRFSLFRTLRKAKWQYIVGELLLIVLGITIALWFNNLNEEWKERDLEHQLLGELKLCLQQDLEDCVNNFDIHEEGVEDIDEMLDLLLETQIPENSGRHFRSLVAWSFLVSNVSTYESMKSIGFQIISNDSIRAGVSTLYNVDYKHVYEIEGKHNELIQKYEDLISTFFMYNKESKNRLNIQHVQAKKMEIISMLLRMRRTHISLRNQYERDVIPHLKQLIKMIDEEIG